MVGSPRPVLGGGAPRENRCRQWRPAPYRGSLMRQIPFPDPGRPDTRSTLRFMVWVAREQWRTQVLGMLAGMVWMVSLALIPAALGRGVDEGIVPGDVGGLVRWALVLLGLGAVAAGTAA